MRTAKELLDYLTILDKSGLNLTELKLGYKKSIHGDFNPIDDYYVLTDSRLSVESINLLFIGDFKGDIADYSNE